MQQPGKKQELTALLGALCLFFATIEYVIPKPLPFMRLGLANLPLMLGLDLLPVSSFFTLVALKIMGQALVSGSLFSYVFLFSLGGTLLSASVMLGLRRALNKHLSFVGLGCAGALVSNIVQIGLAGAFVFGKSSMLMIGPPFLLAGLVTGTALGGFCEYFSVHSTWLKSLNIKATPVPVLEKVERGQPGSRKALFLFIAGLALMPTLVFNPSTVGRVIEFAVFWIFAGLLRRKTSVLATILMSFSIIFFNLLAPYGEVLFAFGPLTITKGALLLGIRRASTVEGLFMLSKACISPNLHIPGAFGRLISESLGIFSRIGEEWRKTRPEHKPSKSEGLVERLDSLLRALVARGTP